MASIHTLESCKELALQFTTRNEWKTKANSSYQAASRNGWMNECTPHMIVSKGGAKAGERNYTTPQWVALYKAIHGDRYSTEFVEYIDSVTKVKLICSEHGIFEQRPASGLNGVGCPRCGLEKQVAARTGRSYNRPSPSRLVTKDVVARINALHNGKLTVSDYGEHTSNKNSIPAICAVHGEYQQRIDKLLHGTGCAKCAATGPSNAENAIFDYVKSICPDAMQSVRSIIAPKEIDIYIPSLKIGIEYNGLWQHSEALNGNADSHQGKTYACNAVGVHLIHIWEDEWLTKQEVIKGYLRGVLGAPQRKIAARNCTVIAVKSSSVREFLDTNHLQGFRGGEGFALYYGDELVAVALVAKTGKGERELIRWCVKLDTRIVGGFSKVLSYFNEPLISFCDTAKHEGKGYLIAGWTPLPTVSKSFHYVDGKRRINRLRMKERYAEIKGAGFPFHRKDVTEREIAAELGFYRIWGCNQLKFKWEPK